MSLVVIAFFFTFWGYNGLSNSFSDQISNFSRNIINEFCLNVRIGGPKCEGSSLSGEYIYGWQDYINSLAGHFKFTITNGKAFTDSLYKRINDAISNKKLLIETIENKIIESCDNNFVDNSDVTGLYFAGGGVRSPNLPDDMAFSPTYQTKVSFSHSVYSIPDDVNFTDNIVDDILRTMDLEDVFKSNLEDICGVNAYCSQYFGSTSGVFRLYPADSFSSSYDPRIRPWYVDASTSTKDIIIIIDNTLSLLNNNKLNIIKDLLNHLLPTLGSYVYVNIIIFGDDNEILLPSCFKEELVKLNDDTGEEFINFIDAITVTTASVHNMTKVRQIYEKCNELQMCAVCTQAFNKAYDVFLNFGESLCRPTILLLTDNLKLSPQPIINERNNETNARIFVFGIGRIDNTTYYDLHNLSVSNGGLYFNIKDDNINTQTKLTSFYLLLNYGINKDAIRTTSPYFDASTGELMITIAKSVYINNEFVGVIGTDTPVRILDDLIGDFKLGYNSYYFLINSKGETIIHPSLPPIEDYLNGLITSPILPDISLLEPDEYTTLGIREDMILGNFGNKKITATIRQSVGDVTLDGYLLIEQELLYIYYPLADKQLSIAFVIYTEKDIDAPLVRSFGLRSAPKTTCNEDSLNQISNCIFDFTMNSNLGKAIECNSYWLTKANIIASSNDTFYPNTPLSFNYSIWRFNSDLYYDFEKAETGNLTCLEFENEHNLTNGLRYNLHNLPYNGIISNSSIYGAQIGNTYFKFVEDKIKQKNRSIVGAGFGSYDGVFLFFPAIGSLDGFNHLKRPWYQLAISYRDKLVVTTPYTDFFSGRLILTGCTGIFAPQSDNLYGVQLVDWTIDNLKAYFLESLPLCQEITNKCYIIDSSGFVVFYDDINNYSSTPTNTSISNIFLGQFNMEPTLVQSMIDNGFLNISTWINFEDYTTDFSYIANDNTYDSKKLSKNSSNFRCNSGEYTIHKIDKTNLYVIYIENYNKTTQYPIDCPNNVLCPNVTIPGCMQNINGSCITPDVDVCSSSYEYPSTHRDECSDIDFSKLYKEMLAENNYLSITMCGWQGLTLSPTSFPTRVPRSNIEYDGYLEVTMEFYYLSNKLSKVLESLNSTSISNLDLLIESKYFEYLPNTVEDYSSYDVLITRISGNKILNNIQKYDSTKNNYGRNLLGANDFIKYQIWTSLDYKFLISSVSTDNSYKSNNHSFEYNLIKSIVLHLDNEISAFNLSKIMNNSNITFSDFITIESEVSLSIIERIYESELLFCNIILIILSLIIGLVSYLHAHCSCKYPRRVDQVNYRAFFLFSVQLWDFISDLAFTQVIYSKWNRKKDSVYQSILFSSLFFVLIPWLANLYSVVVNSEKIKQKFENNEPSIRWFELHSNKVAILTAITGGLYSSLKLVNSRCFGFDLLNMGLSDFELSLFLENKVKINVLFENIPQLILQFIFIIYEKKSNISAFMAMITSILSIITTIIQYKFSKLNNNSQFKRYEIKLIVDDKKQFNLKYSIKRDHNFVKMSDTLCCCLKNKDKREKTKLMENILCVRLCCKNFSKSRNRNESTYDEAIELLKAKYSDKMKIDERRLLFKKLLKLISKHSNIPLRDIQIISITNESHYILILCDYFGKFNKNEVFNNKTISSVIHKCWRLRYNYPVTINENTKQWRKREISFFTDFKQKNKEIRFIQLYDNDSINLTTDNQIYQCSKNKVLNFETQSNTKLISGGLYNRSRELSNFHRQTIQNNRNKNSKIKLFEPIVDLQKISTNSYSCNE